MPFTYEYPRPAVTTDCIVIRYNPDAEILLIKRKFEPFQDCWALPGGFIEMDETLEECAKRELFEETSISNIELTQFYTASKVDRDPRGRTISTIFYGIAHKNTIVKANDDAKELAWFSIKNLPDLAFDHQMIIEKYKELIIY